MLTADPPVSQDVKTPLVGMTPQALRALATSLGEPAFRADQLHHWLYVKNARGFEEMSNLAKGFRSRLAQAYTVGCVTLADKQTSSDGTVKYLFRLADGKTVESVLMRFEDRDSLSACLSTQAGCAVGCSFCATGALGFSRQLTPGEIVDQYLAVQRDAGQEVRNVVLMGQGEPLLNFDATVAAIELLNRSAEVGMRHITLSTSGVAPQILELAERQWQLVLAVSLHAPDNALRDELVPINRKWPLEKLMGALRAYVSQTGRRLTIEYVMLAGVNDSPAQAQRLAGLLDGLKCNVNLIPYNPTGPQSRYQRPSRRAIDAFARLVGQSGKKVTVRLERGVDIAAACGQLANRFQNQNA
ncbi:MAG: 23S rRNA (adenine(2503)-C(2))-methyltransferase RlmN [Vampirovibrionales bacterium]|nr:23S rRNA (adenine(2503)-C(2))-methyltransferase RlmN [Vampirovibrionales bacterium]